MHFTSSDRKASLPANYAFTATDAGVHTFSVTLNTTGTKSLTVTDTNTKTIKGTDSSIQVGAPQVQTLAQGSSPALAASDNTLALSNDQMLWEELVTALLETHPSKRFLGIT